jgi:hypothetical protein
MIGPAYRIHQFFASVRARSLNLTEANLAQRFLPEEAFELFRAMPAGDQRHSLMILQGLLEQGYRDRPLLQAALLHDVAKADVHLWHRTVVILLNAVSKQLLPRLASSSPRSWRYPFYLSLYHPEIGAEMAARAGVDPRAVTLIRHHQSKPKHSNGNSWGRAVEGDLGKWQRALKALDDQN